MNTTDSCYYPSWYPTLMDTSTRLIYFGLAPLYVFFGLTGHSVILFSLYDQSRKEDSQIYLYQILLIVSEGLEIVTNLFYLASMFWLRYISWFLNCYSCQWFRAHLATPLVNSMVTNTLLLSILLTLDRLYALTKPVQYHILTNNRKKYYIQIFLCNIIVICLSFSSSVFDCFRFKLVLTEKNIYEFAVNEEFVESSLANSLAQVRNFIRLLGLIGLIISNIALIYVYRKKIKQHENLTHESMKQNEKTLTSLTVYQNSLNTLNTTVLTSYYILIYVKPVFHLCYRYLSGPCVDAIFMLTNSVNFYLIFLFNRRVRETIFASFPFLRKCTRTVSPSH